MPSSACRKSFAFSQTVCLFQMEKRASPLFQAFFPLQLVFCLNQAAVFRQSRRLSGVRSAFFFCAITNFAASKRPAKHFL